MLKNTKLFIFLFKIIPYLYEDTKNSVFEKIEEHYNYINLIQGYNKFIKYYKDNWLYNPYINFIIWKLVMMSILIELIIF